MRTFKATVTDVKWFTTALGFVRPVAVLDKQYSKKVNKKETIKFDSVTISNARNLELNGVGKGMVLKLKTKADKSISIKSFGEKQETSMPQICPSCGEQLQVYKDVDLYCPNDFCYAKSRTPVLKLLSCVDSTYKQDFLYGYLNDYVNKLGNHMPIKDLYDFVHLFKDMENTINTTSRVDILKDNFKNPDEVNEFEKEVIEYMSKKPSNRDFWYILNIPKLDEKTIDKLSLYDYSTIKPETMAQELTGLGLTQHEIQSIALNAQSIVQLGKYFAYFQK